MQPADIPEIPLSGESPKDCAERLAREKALAVFRQRPDDCVLGADTVVFVNGEILGKPNDDADAARMLRLLSGRTHQVITGLCLMIRKEAESGSSRCTLPNHAGHHGPADRTTDQLLCRHR